MSTTILFIIFVVLCIVMQSVFWCVIETTLNKMGHKCEALRLWRYPGEVRTLWEYKKVTVAENKTLVWWWLYWWTHNCAVVVSIVYMCIVFSR
jgi:hypothetical protein